MYDDSFYSFSEVFNWIWKPNPIIIPCLPDITSWNVFIRELTKNSMYKKNLSLSLSSKNVLVNLVKLDILKHSYLH